MSTGEVATAPTSGEVYRRGDDLVIIAPAGITRTAWLTLEQELHMQAGARTTGERELTTSADRSDDVRDILARPWPAGRWPWVWDAEALGAADRARGIRASVDRILDGDVTPVDDVDGRLARGGFERRLLLSQREAVARLAASEGGGNFSVPGSGKTTMTYAVYVLLREAGLVDRMLVIAPQSAYEAWADEAVDCFAPGRDPKVELAPRAPRRDTEVIVINYERAAVGATRAVVDAWAHGHRFLVVFDEAHRAKRGRSGLHGAGALDLAGMAAARLVLTGTPLPNGLQDLEAVLELAWPGEGARLADPHTRHGERSWVRITKDELELDAAEVSIEPVRLDDSHLRIYHAVAAGLLDNPEALVKHPELAARAITRLIACAANPLLLAESGTDALRWPHELPLSDELASVLDDLTVAARPAKLLAAARHAAAHAEAGTKLLVWSNFIGNIRELERLMQPYGTAVVTGALPRSDPDAKTDRERELRRFRHDADCTVLIATPQTLGEGVSLHKACQAQLHVDRTFNAGLFLQAMDRTHRVGMPEGTTARVTVLSAMGTIDERVDRALQSKLRGMDDVLSDPALARLAGLEVGPAAAMFEPAELRGLLQHLRP